MWSDDSEDYRRPVASVLVHNVLEQVHPDGIVLMHDGGGNRAQTVKALPKIIAELKRRGYNFVTVLELLALQDKEFKTA
jgi:chitin deacetylase